MATTTELAWRLFYLRTLANSIRSDSTLLTIGIHPYQSPKNLQHPPTPTNSSPHRPFQQPLTLATSHLRRNTPFASSPHPTIPVIRHSSKPLLGFPRPPRLDLPNIKVSHQRCRNFVDFQICQVSSRAGIVSRAELDHVPIHLRGLVRVEPARGVVGCGRFAELEGGAVDGPGVDGEGFLCRAKGMLVVRWVLWRGVVGFWGRGKVRAKTRGSLPLFRNDGRRRRDLLLEQCEGGRLRRRGGSGRSL